MVDNWSNLGNRGKELLDALAAKLPPGWRILDTRPFVRPPNAPSVDLMLKIRCPDGKTCSVFVETKRRLEPKDVDYLMVRDGETDKPILIAAPFISPRTQERLKARGFGYVDLTGNIFLTLSRPGLFIETTGATENPAPMSRERKSLKGAKAGRLIRALCDFLPPIGLRELAKRAGVDPGYASRIVDLLDREALVTRRERGPIIKTDWPALIRRWSQEYSPFERQRSSWHLAPRGIEQVLKELKTLSGRYAVSGSWAAAQFAPVSPTRMFLCYAENVSAVVRALDLRAAETGANVVLAVPFDPVVYERTVEKKGITVAALSQVAVDLLNSPGRGPNEAEALIEWMRDNENVWRT